jgi:hypothetical protein
MSSQRRIDASRANGARSHGPTTPEGQAISARNSVRHGMTSKTVVLTNESSVRFEQILESYVNYFQPQNEVEMDLVEEMAVAKWRQRRAWSVETATLDHEMDCQDPELAKKWGRLDHPTRLALAHESLAQRTQSLNLIGRYETRLRRHYDKSLQNLYLVRSKTCSGETNFLPDEPSPNNEHPIDVPTAGLPKQ